MPRTRKPNSATPRPDRRAPAYPRPMLQRPQWSCLDGTWEFAIDPDAKWTAPGQVTFDRAIEVPFAPETPASGVHDGGLFRATWYRRTFDTAVPPAGHRLLLHFAAVDYEATVWVNGRQVVRHEGGYTPFVADVTDQLDPAGTQEIVVRAFDDPADLAKPRGKQDWQRDAHAIWYMRTSGIWQSVWTELVRERRVESLRWFPDAERWQIGLEAAIAGVAHDEAACDLRLRVRLTVGARVLADDTYAVTGHEVSRKIGLADPGIDDFRNELLWSPDRPTLIDAQLELLDASGHVIDSASSYTALRSVAVLGNRFVLNGKPLPLRLVLDQGYWEESGLTAPTDDAFRRDVELLKAMGFNGVRMHQKIESPRFLYWADRLGLLVWEEMPSPYRFTPKAVERLTRQWADAILRDVSHPSIVAWVPINESWGVPDLPDSPAQRHFVRAIYHLTRTLDPTRPVIGNDGWEAAATDIVAIHDYDADVARIAKRYASTDPTGVRELLRTERPGYKVLTLEGFEYHGQPVMLTEFGGIAFSDRAGSWGYSRAASADEFARAYFHLLDTVRSLPLLSGFCYTQFTDTYQEANGLLYMDRTPKFPIEQIALATRGARTPDERQQEHRWRTGGTGKL